MLVTPVLLVLLMLIVQFALWFHGAHVASAAAQEGARAARVVGGTGAEGEARARRFLANLGREVVAEPRVSVDRDPGWARAEIWGRAVPVVPGLRLPIHAVSEGPSERFRPPTEP